MSTPTPLPLASTLPPALQTLLSRYSLGGKHLREPGPSAAQLEWMVQAALRAPDHGELTPFSFVAVQGAARQRLAELFARYASAQGKSAEAQALERERALSAPLTLAVLARLDLGHRLAPAHEQWIALGGAIANMLNAAHALGFAGKMLSGEKARSALIAEAFCQPGETLVGWLVLGTPTRAPSSPGERPQHQRALRHWADQP